MKINILKEEIDIRFNMAVELAYEEITDEEFNVESLKKMKNTLALGMAAIIVANKNTEITIDRLLKEATGPEIAALNQAVLESMTEWLSIPEVIAKEDAKEPQPDVNEEQPKN